MRFRLTVVSLVLLGACAAPAIEDDLNAGDLPLPERRPGDDRDGGGGGGGDTGGGKITPTDFTVTVTMSGSGAGTMTSTPAGMSCTGTTCTGKFAKGTSVALQLAPVAGSVFTGWTGKCTGMAACAPVVDADVSVGAALESLDGAWTGTYTNTRTVTLASGNNCTFTNNGNLGATVTATAATFASSETLSGLQIRDGNCTVVDTRNGTAPSEPLTVTGTTVTGTFTVSVASIGGSLPFPFTATLTAKKLEGKWTCATCTGGFTLTKP